MDNYSLLQKVLHALLLQKQGAREVTFEIESSIFQPTNIRDDHVFVVGLARSGTTALLNAIYKSDCFASLSYADMPFVLAPNLWSKLVKSKSTWAASERAHGDGLNISLDSPEAFEEIFWKTFCNESTETKNKFVRYVHLIAKKYNKKRYLSKNNQNLKRLGLIADIFPNSKILVPFRTPLQQAYSLLTQHQKFCDIALSDKFVATYMNWLGHHEFGQGYIPMYTDNLRFENHLDVNHWLEQWYLAYSSLLKISKADKHLCFVCYENLCRGEDTWNDICRLIGIEISYAPEFSESVKNISLKSDNKLLRECNSLYEHLVTERIS